MVAGVWLTSRANFLDIVLYDTLSSCYNDNKSIPNDSLRFPMRYRACACDSAVDTASGSAQPIEPAMGTFN